MKTREQIKTEIENNISERKKVWVRMIKFPDHLDFLIDSKFVHNSKIIKTPLIIKRNKKYIYSLSVMWLIAIAIAFLGPHSKSNYDFFLKALNFEFFPLLIFLLILVAYPVVCIFYIFKRKDPIIINDKSIQLPSKKELLFSDTIFICFLKKRQGKSMTQCLKFYLKDGTEVIQEIDDWEINKKELGQVLHGLMESDTSTTANTA